MISIDIITTTRAEYGLMRPLIKRMREDADIQMNLLVTGTHLSEQHGYTFKEIEDDGYRINAKIPILSEKKGVEGVSETISNAITEFTQYYKTNRPDFILVDGDRYETLGICLAAVNTNIPIIHIGGGETTEGASDECYRHAMTKMAYLHFAITETYRNRIVQMGENPNRVFTSGSLGVENIANIEYLSREELSKQIGWSLTKPFAVVTFHPVTLENNTCEQQLNELLKACNVRQDMQFIITKANADNGGDEINHILDEYVVHSNNAICIASLGAVRYINALRHAEFVMGNSSSGIIEAPSLKVPTINIGDRQRGRIQAESIINCEPQEKDILKAIEKALMPEFKSLCKTVVNPNGDGNASMKIIKNIKEYCCNNQIDIKKRFYDLQ